MIRRRLERLEAQKPRPKEWRYTARDLTDLEQGWGPMSDTEREFLMPLSLDEARRLERNLYHLPIDQLRDLAADYAIARYIYFCRVLRHWDAPDPPEELERAAELQN